MNIINTIENKNDKLKFNNNLIMVCISFKLNNVFITVSEFTKCFDIFMLNKVLKSYSYGLIKIKNKDKDKIKSGVLIAEELKQFLINSNINKIYVTFKSSIKIKHTFLRMLLNTIYKNNFIKIIDVFINLSIPFNGCRLKKRKFL